MTLRDYYQNLKKEERPIHPAQAFVIQLAVLTGRSPKTVRQWLSGIQLPPRSEREKISQHLGIEAVELFP